jgi:hypothetical protein
MDGGQVGREGGGHGSTIRSSGHSRAGNPADQARTRPLARARRPRADLHPTWLSHIEGGSNPAWGTVRRIASALGVEISELASLAEQIERENPWEPLRCVHDQSS